MKREKARLTELRSMPYEEYLQTPEWQEVQKLALKRANQCQGCKAENVTLSAYHTNYDNLGCEQEDDVIVLCEACYDRLSRYGKQTGDEMSEEPSEQAYPRFSFGKKASVFGSTALVTMGLPAILHAPLPAEIFGLSVAVTLALNSPKIYAHMREDLPAPLVEWLDRQAERKRQREATGEWSTWDRLWGRHMHAHAANLDVEQEETEAAYDDYLDLGPTLKPHADLMLSGRKVILGVSGSGKTNNMNVYIEELGKLRPAPALLLFDTDDENRALCDRKYLPNPMWLDKSKRLTADNAFESAQTIMERRYQCIINLQSYEDEEAAWIMINMIKGVRAWQEAREVRIPCEIVLDEASVWLPQNPKESLLSSILVDDSDAPLDEDEDEEKTEQVRGRGKQIKKISLLVLLQRVFFSTVRRGRRRGMGFTLATQRIAEIDKRALQGSWNFLMRQTQPADWREYAKYGITPEEAMNLLDGEAFVFAPGKPREKHRFRESNSPHGGVTPGMKALRGSTKMQQGVARPSAQKLEARGLPTSETRKQAERPDSSREAAIDTVLQLRGKVDERTFLALLDALPAITTEEAEVVVTRKLPDTQTTDGATNDRSRLRTMSRHSKGAVSQRHPAAGLPHILREALEAHVPGMTYRDLGAVLGYSDGEAREIWLELKRRGLLRVAEVVTPGQAKAVQGQGTYLRSLPRPEKTQMEDIPGRPIDPADLAKAFALWQADASSVRKLEAAAKAAGYAWSNGKVRALIEEMRKRGLIQGEQEQGVL